MDGKVVDCDSCIMITVKPALGDHPFVKLKVVAQNRWSLNEGLLTGTGVVTVVSFCLTSCINDNWPIPFIIKMANTDYQPSIDASLLIGDDRVANFCGVSRQMISKIGE